MPLYTAYLFLNVIIISICTGISSYSLAISVLGKKPGRKSGILVLAISLAINMIVNFLMSLTGKAAMDNDQLLIWNLSFSSITTVVLSLLLIKIHKTKFVITVSAVMISEFVVMTAGNLLQELMYYEYMEEVQQLKLIQYIFKANTLPNMLMLVLALFIGLILRKFKLNQYFAVIFVRKQRAYITMGISFILLHSYAVIRFLSGGELKTGIAVLFSVLIVMALFVLQLMSMYTASQEKVKAQEDIIVMQQQHLELLEELQQEMKSFRHDFTNLISGVSEQVKTGDLAGIQEFMRNTSVYFDERLGNEIRQIESVSNIQISSLRSLITSKIAMMQSKEIKFQLEIIKLITESSMRTEDLIRCIGILLDNAIEEAERSSGKLVNMVLLQEKHELYVAIANTYVEKPDMVRIQQGGYSTKGENRGSGIKSLKKIVNAYPRCTTRMIVREGMFRQELRIER